MSEFTGHPLVLGSARGARVFAVDSLARLTGVSYRQVWTPDENDADCKIPVYSEEKAKAITDRYYGVNREVRVQTLGGFQYVTQPRYRVKGQPHDLQGCTCGFYAYYDGGDNQYAEKGTVHGVIEAWGETTIGSRGFRASSARILALAVPAPDLTKVLRARRIRKLLLWGGGAGAAFGLFALVSGLIGQYWISAGVGLFGLAVNGYFFVKNWRAKTELPVDDSAELRERVSRNYPDVPMFESVELMLAEFPPDRGEEPTPETDPDFWTRSAS